MPRARRWTSSAIILTAIAATVLGGCGSQGDEAIVASINGEEITVGYIQAKWAKIAANNPGVLPDSMDPDSARAKLLDVIINKELIVQQAREQGYTANENYQRAFQGHRDYRLIELLKNKQIVDKIPVYTDEDLQDHYSHLGKKAHARHLDVDTEDEAKLIVSRIESGEISFREAVSRYSTNDDRSSGGKMGLIAFGSNIEAVENTLFNMAEGEMSAPVQTPYGWSVFMLDKLEIEQPQPFIEVKELIRRRLEMRAAREIGDAHGKAVLDKYGFKFNWDAAAIIIERMPDDLPASQIAQQASKGREVYPLLKFTDEEKAMVLYELQGEKHTLADFSDTYDGLSGFERPQKTARMQGVYSYVRRQATGIVMPLEARAQDLDQDHDFQVIMKEYEEQACIGVVRAQIVDRGVEVADEDVRAWYDDNPKYYTTLPMIIVKQLLVHEEEKIQEALSRIDGGEDFDHVGADLSLNYRTNFISQPLYPDTLSAPDNVAFRHLARLTDVGQITPAFFMQGYWVICQLMERNPSRLMSWEESEGKARGDLMEHLSNERLEALLAEWREAADIVIDEKLLATIERGEMPDPRHEIF